MTAPDPLANIALPFSVVMQPAWADPLATVMSGYRNPAVSDPLKRVLIPAGVSVVRVANEARFVATFKIDRDGSIRTLAEVVSEGIFEVVTENPSEMWVEWSDTPNTNDRATTRLGLTIIPTSPPA